MADQPIEASSADTAPHVPSPLHNTIFFRKIVRQDAVRLTLPEIEDITAHPTR